MRLIERLGARACRPAPLRCAVPDLCCCLWRRVVCCRAGLLVVPVGGGPPASRPRCELRSARRLEARPGPAAAHGHRSQALLRPSVPPAPSTPAALAVRGVAWRVVSKPARALRSLRRPPNQWGLRCCWRSARRLEARPGPAAAAHWRCGHASDPSSALHAGGLFCVGYRSGSPATSHVIPSQVFQILNSGRWNCNVFGRSRKMTEGNYVRLLFGGSPFIEALPGLPVPFTPVLPGVLPCLWRRWCSGCRRPLLCEIPEWFPSNVARNSPASISNIEFRSLELQRFRVVSKNDRGKLRARFVWAVTCYPPAQSPTRAR